MIGTYYDIDGQEVDREKVTLCECLDKSVDMAIGITGGELILKNSRLNWALVGTGNVRLLITP